MASASTKLASAVRHGARNARVWNAVLVALIAAGCSGPMNVPDQSRFADLESLAALDEPIVRLYVSPINPGFAFLASHPWFVTKRADEQTFQRWEVSATSAEPYDFVRLNYHSPEFYYHPVYVCAELRGQAAEEVVRFINRQAPTYPCRFVYTLFPGPNSNTFAQWVLDQTGWDVKLPNNALGRGMAAECR